MYIDFWRTIYRTYWKRSKSTADIQTIGVVSVLMVFLINFFLSVLMYSLSYSLLNFSRVQYVVFLLIVFLSLYYFNYQFFKKNKKQIVVNHNRGKKFKYIVYLVEFLVFVLGMYSAVLFKASNGL